MALDASMLSTFRSCPQKFKLEYLDCWRPRKPSIHLHAGKCFAAALEIARLSFHVSGNSPAVALELGRATLAQEWGDFPTTDKDTKTLPRMLGAFDYYFDRYPLDKDPAQPVRFADRLGIEFSFAQPLPIQHPESGEPLIWCGRADQIVDYAGGCYVSDEKTTSSLGSSWSRQWDLRSQFSGYCWAARLAGIRVDGVLVRGLSILKTKYDTQEAISYRPEWQVERWFQQTCRDIERLIEAWKEGYFDWNLDHACGDFGGCTYRQICTIQDPQDFFEASFEKRKWDPLTRTEIRL